jgi:hypothetical protein
MNVNLVVENGIEEGTVHVQSLVVVNEAPLPELIRKETDAGARGADHLNQHVLTDLHDHWLLLAFFRKMGQQQIACCY